MFAQFTDRARRVVVQAQQEARTRSHDYIGTEHLLLGLIAKEDDAVVLVLHTLGLSAPAIREKLNEMKPPGLLPHDGHIPFTPRAKTTLEHSRFEAQRRGHEHIDAEHILWALSQQPDATATKALARLGATPQSIRQQALRGWTPPA